MQCDLIRVSEFCDRFAVSRTTFYRLVQKGDLQICKVGSATRVKLADAQAWLASLAT